jgi:glycosyltransferase involved in cell wall biosynthesis
MGESDLLRILLLAQFFPPDYGGEEWHVFNLANALASRNHNVAVATQRVPGMPDEEILPSGVRIYRFSTAAMGLPGVYSTGRAHHPPVPDPVGVRELRRIIRQTRPEVVHAHNWSVNSALPLRGHSSASRQFGLVLTLHDLSHVCATKRFMRNGAPCEGPSIRRCLPCTAHHYRGPVGPFTLVANYAMRQWKDRAIDHFVSVSSAVAKGAGVIGLPNSSIIPNFVPDSVLEHRSEAECTGVGLPLPMVPFLLFVGDLCEEKGVLTLLRAYESMPPGRPPLVLIGKRRPDTPDSLPDGAVMHFDWPHDHVMEAFRRCLFAVTPSICPDACPTTVIEAMACGRPVVATHTGGIVDMVVNGESGLMVSPGSANALAEAMWSLVADDELRGRLAAGAHAQARSFTASAVVDRLEDIYRRIAPPRGDVAVPQGDEVGD